MRLIPRAGRSTVWVTKANVRKLLVILHDLLATPAAMLAAFYIRFEGPGLDTRRDLLLWFVPAFTLYAGVIYKGFGLYESKWRFASLPDLSNIFRAATLLALSLVVLDYVLASSALYGTFFFGKITILLYWFLQMFFLGGSRISYRYFRYTRTRRHATDADSKPCLVLGRAADAELVMRAIESGAVKKIWPLGVLSPAASDQGMVVRNMRVLGTFDDLEAAVADLERRGTAVSQLVLTASALDPASQPELILNRARRLGIDVRYLAGVEESGSLSAPAVRLTKIDVEDLLLRPSVGIDYGRLERFVRGKSIAVTGGGGSIGAEICSRVATFGAARILVIENSEPALWSVLEKLQGKGTAVVEGRIADVRDRNRMFRLLGQFKPDLVFHAAALKHVQLVEREWSEGVRTNVFGSVNIADAAVAAGARIMVMISTDKAIEPVSVLGATKRIAEMYCQALNAELVSRRAEESVVPMNREGTPTRLISVRFGNVLASNGSVVPKFRAQIEAGGPVTVTHPDMVRYFMTLREASDLVVTAASHAGGLNSEDGSSVYVLNMGQPVRIVDMAERMIRLSGYEPGRDIEIAFTGMRQGERLNEILFARDEPVRDVGIPGIVAAVPPCPSHKAILAALAGLEQSLQNDERDALARVFRETVPDYRGAAA